MEEKELAEEVAARLDMDEGVVADVVREVMDVVGTGEVDAGVLGKGSGYGYGGVDDEAGVLERGAGYDHGGSGDEPLG